MSGGPADWPPGRPSARGENNAAHGDEEVEAEVEGTEAGAVPHG